MISPGLALATILVLRGAPAAEYEWTQVTVDAGFMPRDGAGAVVHNNLMYLLGGWNPPVLPKASTTSEVLVSDGGVWTSLGEAAWQRRHCAGYVEFNGRMWILGGDGSQSHYQPDVWSSANGLQWRRELDAPWGHRNGQIAAVFDKRIWVMGGQSMGVDAPPPRFTELTPEDDFHSDVWVLSPDGRAWTQVTADAGWKPRGYAGAVAYNGALWLLGGGTYKTPNLAPPKYYSDVWKTRDGKTWTQVAADAGWEPRIFSTATVWDGRLWVVGGIDQTVNVPGFAWWSKDGIRWTRVDGGPSARHSTSVFARGDELWVVAGNDGNLRNDVWVLRRKHSKR